MMKIYFAGSIRGSPADKDLYLEIINYLKTKGAVLTEHIADKSITPEGEKDLSEEAIHNRDMGWLDSAGVVVAEVTAPSLGVGYELGRIVEHDRDEGNQRRPILCLYRPQEGKRLSAMIKGCSGVEVREYNSLDEAKKAIDIFLKSIPEQRSSDLEDFLL